MAFLLKSIFKVIRTKLPSNLYRYSHIQNTINFTSSTGQGIRDILFARVQTEKDKPVRRVSIVGAAGQVGQELAYDLILRRFCDEVVLCDPPASEKVCGVGLDLVGGRATGRFPNIKVCINGELTRNSELIIITAGKGVAKGQTRLDALQENIELYRKLIPTLASLSPNSVLLIVTNPVDIMTYAAWKFSGFPVNRVLGTGTELDSSRFRFFLSKKLGIAPKAINAWVIGEHGLSCVPCWSTINVAGTRLRDIKDCFGLKEDPECWTDLEDRIKQNANMVKGLKGFTSFSISMTASKIAHAILGDRRTVHAVSTCCNGIQGIQVKSFMSLPSVIGNTGVSQIVIPQLDCLEQEKLKKSAAFLDEAMSKIVF